MRTPRRVPSVRTATALAGLALASVPAPSFAQDVQATAPAAGSTAPPQVAPASPPEGAPPPAPAPLSYAAPPAYAPPAYAAPSAYGPPPAYGPPYGYTGPHAYPPGARVVFRDSEGEGEREKRDAPGPGMRNAGIGLTLGGCGVGIAGAIAIASADNGDRVGPIVAGMGLGIVGGAMVLTGIPLWAVGAARYKGGDKGSTAGMTLSVGAAGARFDGRF